MTKPNRTKAEGVIPIEQVERKIYLLRGQKVILDTDLAQLYQVETRVLLQAVKRHQERFPEDFMLRLTREEFAVLTSQSVISNADASTHGGRRYLPYAFTEHGVAMLSSVLKSPRAVQMNIVIIRAFIQLRNMLAQHRDLADRLGRLEASQQQHANVIQLLAQEIDQLKQPPPAPPRKPIGFKSAPAD